MLRANGRLTLFARALGLSALLLGAAAAPGAAQDSVRVNEGNLPEVLRSMVGQIPAGMRINDYTVVRNAEASGNTFTTNYLVDIPDYQPDPADFRQEDIDQEARLMCGNQSLQTLMKFGANFARVYRAPDGTLLYQIEIDKQRCKDLA